MGMDPDESLTFAVEALDGRRLWFTLRRTHRMRIMFQEYYRRTAQAPGGGAGGGAGAGAGALAPAPPAPPPGAAADAKPPPAPGARAGCLLYTSPSPRDS